MENLQTFILNTQEPFLLKNSLTWSFLNWDLEKWTEVFGDECLSFRVGKNQFTSEPQFENTTRSVQMTFREFLKHQEKNPREWLYFDYKYLKDWLKNSNELRKNINWKDVGFPLLNSDDSTIWIGSQGAHTPCHADSYGCNIIAQIYGRKRWMIFPPNENLMPSRIPYEESSIYSQLNFFSPSVEKFKEIHHCRTVILEPGDVLILPHKWWHYVENVDLAISLNTWIPLPIDHEERISESIVQMLIVQLTKSLDMQTRNQFLNPSGDSEEVLNADLQESAQVVMSALALRNLHQNSFSQNQSTSVPNLNILRPINELTKSEFQNLLKIQKERFDIENSLTNEAEVAETNVKKVINTILHPDVINMIKNKLLESLYL